MVRVLQYFIFYSQWKKIGNTIEGNNGFDYIGEAIALLEDGFVVAMIGSGQADQEAMIHASPTNMSSCWD
jgi:hypothetical protein